MKTTKPFEISSHDVLRAWELVKANDGAEGVDGESIEQFEFNLEGNLYKIWNRLSPGSYFPQPSKAAPVFGQTSLGDLTPYDFMTTSKKPVNSKLACA